MKRLVCISAIGLAVLAIGTPARASSFTFTTSCTTNSDPGLVVYCNLANPGPVTVTLNSVGASAVLPFAVVGTLETGVNLDDLKPDPVSANFAFSSPVGSATAVGLAGWFLASYVTWAPTVATVGDSALSIEIGNAFFGVPGSAAVNFRVTCLRGCAPYVPELEIDALDALHTPEPGSMILLGTGLVGLLAAARRRRRTAR